LRKGKEGKRNMEKKRVKKERLKKDSSPPTRERGKRMPFLPLERKKKKKYTRSREKGREGGEFSPHIGKKKMRN